MSQSIIVIEGTVTPSTFLATGERRTVTRTPFIDKLIAKGFVRVFDVLTTPLPESIPVEQTTDEVEDTAVVVPKKNETREVWAEFLARRRIPFTDDDRRDDLIAIYENSPYFVLDDDRG